MTDTFDTPENRAIVEIAERLVRDWADAPSKVAAPNCRALYDAVAAKREAERPKLLTAEEAHKLWRDGPGIMNSDDFDLVLTAAHDRVLKVIEALPDSGNAREKWVRLDDIRRALTGGAGS